MIKKFEIKSHDGPGRIGKIDGVLTPKIFFKDDLKIAPSEGSAHNIDREIAEFNVNETLSLKPLFDYSNKEIHLNDGQFEEEILDSNEIDLDNFIYQSVTLSFPNKLVCDINCKGSIELQKVKKDFVQDPRLEIFNKLKKDN